MMQRTRRIALLVAATVVVGVATAFVAAAINRPDPSGTTDGPVSPGPTWSEERMRDASPEPMPSD